jgi:hypothetical protein
MSMNSLQQSINLGHSDAINTYPSSTRDCRSICSDPPQSCLNCIPHSSCHYQQIHRLYPSGDSTARGSEPSVSTLARACAGVSPHRSRIAYIFISSANIHCIPYLLQLNCHSFLMPTMKFHRCYHRPRLTAGRQSLPKAAFSSVWADGKRSPEPSDVLKCSEQENGASHGEVCLSVDGKQRFEQLRPIIFNGWSSSCRTSGRSIAFRSKRIGFSSSISSLLALRPHGWGRAAQID